MKPQHSQSITLKALYHMNGLLVYVFFALTFAIWGGTGYSMAVALLFSPLGLWLTRNQPIPKHLKLLALAMGAMFLLHWWVEWRGDGFKLEEFDHPRRFLLFVPILIFRAKDWPGNYVSQYQPVS